MLIVVSSKPHVTKKLLLLGETGNHISGKEVFVLGDDAIATCTTAVSSNAGLLSGGTAEQAIRVEVTDTPGFCDPKNHDVEEFLGQLADHLRSPQGDGTHGIVYLQDACSRRCRGCARESLNALVATLTEAEEKLENLSGRMLVLMTGSSCRDSLRWELQENELPKQLCSDYNLCSVQLIWYEDDFLTQQETGSLFSGLWSSLIHDTSRRDMFTRWVRHLPVNPMFMTKRTQL